MANDGYIWQVHDHDGEEEEDGVDDHGADGGDECDDDNDQSGDANGQW